MGPKGVAVDKNGHIITVDNKACCVFIFQSNGKLVTKFGGRGTSDRQFAGENKKSNHTQATPPSLLTLQRSPAFTDPASGSEYFINSENIVCYS